MPFTLFAPGTRKANPYWIALVHAGGHRVERSTRTANKAEAKRFAEALERELLKAEPPKPGDKVSFEEAARLYAAWRGIDLDFPKAHYGNERTEAVAINRLIGQLGRRAIAGMAQLDLVAAANRLYPGRAPATKNRWALKLGARILHYAARQKLCGWERIEKFKEKRPVTRAVSVDVAAALVAAAPQGPKRLLLVWLFRHGTRITDTLQIGWEDNLDLARMTVRLRIGKGDKWSEKRLHPEVFELLAEIPETERTGRLFPWRTRSGVYRWLRPLAGGLGIRMTPHMARHSIGTWLNQEGAGLRTIMAALDHDDPSSSIRYQFADIDIVAAATRRFAPITGKRRGAA